MAPTRVEHDLLGDRAVPAEAYYGIHTLRAVENFPISGTQISIYPDLVNALAAIKKAAALANRDLGMLDPAHADAIGAACDEIRAGHLHAEFVVDVIQGGAGTSTNMNANEVIANRALELMGHARGAYAHLHPNTHVNMSQSTNDVYPTALKLAAVTGIRRLCAAMATLRSAFEAKATEFADIVKIGRTQLQDAVPLTLGQEFSGYATQVANAIVRIEMTMPGLLELAQGLAHRSATRPELVGDGHFLSQTNSPFQVCAADSEQCSVCRWYR
ncbi:MAG: hypothetical protein HC767_14690 [Akkermansiaceae bacterium]|nr:hypothetical protein [Akkermansiaceae bacterium]